MIAKQSKKDKIEPNMRLLQKKMHACLLLLDCKFNCRLYNI